MTRVEWAAPGPRWVLTSGIPRSGTSWVHRIVWDLLVRSGVGLRDRLGADGQRLDDFPTNALGDAEDVRMRAALARWREEPRGVRVAKTHYFPGSSLTEGERFRLVWVWRDLRDVVASTCHFARTGPAREVFGDLPEDEAYRRVTAMVLPPQLAVLRHLVAHRPPESTLVLEYSRIHGDLPGAVARIAAHIGVDADPAAVAEVAAAHRFEAESGRAPGEEDRSRYHRMGAVGGWRQTLPAVARERIEQQAPDLEALQESMWKTYPG